MSNPSLRVSRSRPEIFDDGPDICTHCAVMNVIRMVKLFGWESRIATQLNEKRELELVSVKKNRLYGMANDICKCVLVILSSCCELTDQTTAT